MSEQPDDVDKLLARMRVNREQQEKNDAQGALMIYILALVLLSAGTWDLWALNWVGGLLFGLFSLAMLGLPVAMLVIDLTDAPVDAAPYPPGAVPVRLPGGELGLLMNSDHPEGRL